MLEAAFPRGAKRDGDFLRDLGPEGTKTVVGQWADYALDSQHSTVANRREAAQDGQSLVALVSFSLISRQLDQIGSNTKTSKKKFRRSRYNRLRQVGL